MTKKKDDPPVDEFKETIDMTGLIIDEIREKLGDDGALVTDTLLNLQNTLTKATEIHTGVVEEKEKVTQRNLELLDVNNNLFIKNSTNKKIDDQAPEPGKYKENSLEKYVNAKIKK